MDELELEDIDFASLPDPFEGVTIEPLLSESETIEGFVNGVLQDKRLSHIEPDALAMAARIIARGLCGDPDAREAMQLIAVGIDLAHTELGWTVTRNVKECRG